MKKLLVVLMLMFIPMTCSASDRMVYVGIQNNVRYMVDIDSYKLTDDGHIIMGMLAEDLQTNIISAIIMDANRENHTYKVLSTRVYIKGTMVELNGDETIYTYTEESMLGKAIHYILKNN